MPAIFFRSSIFFLCLLFSSVLRALPVISPDCIVPSPPLQQNFAKLVIIIDDLGNNLRRGRQVLALPGNVTYAIIPFTPHIKKLAQVAEDAGKEVMLHAPMSTVTNLPLGRGGLTPELSPQEFRATLSAALDELPQATGINNHMGSELTQQRLQMAWVMQELRERDLYFVDSRTSENSIAARVASDFNVPNLSRDVFLDNDPTEAAIDAQFQQVLRRAQRHGLGIAIGHPHAATINYLRKTLPQLEAQGVRLAFVSEIIEEQIAAREDEKNALAVNIDSLNALEAPDAGCEDPAATPEHAGGAATETATAAPAES